MFWKRSIVLLCTSNLWWRCICLVQCPDIVGKLRIGINIYISESWLIYGIVYTLLAIVKENVCVCNNTEEFHQSYIVDYADWVGRS